MVNRFLFPITTFLLLLGCETATSSDTSEPIGRTSLAADGGIVQGGAWIIPDSVRGAVPSSALGVPSFSGVRNQDSQVVTQDALLGHFSVMWFYPFANTSG